MKNIFIITLINNNNNNTNMRKTTLFIITFLTLFVYTNADAYKDGFIIGYVTHVNLSELRLKNESGS